MGQLLDLGILREDLDVNCPGGEYVQATMFYRRGRKGTFVLQTDLPNTFRSTRPSGGANPVEIAKGDVNSHCNKQCSSGETCLKKTMKLNLG